LEPLKAVHWQTVTIPIQRILKLLGTKEFCQRFYLAGGTGLALQLGHRHSVDLDFFSETDELDQASRNQIIGELASLSPKIAETTEGNLYLIIEGVRVSFHSYHNPLLEPLRQLDQVPIASVMDIGLMKLDALITRGSRKDFYDLFAITWQIQLDQLLDRSAEKYPQFRDFALQAVESMILFDNADRDRQPALLIDTSWEDVRRFFLDTARDLANRWFIK
jgi:predicted nucleotidyltransferase component of viral defense system